MSEKSLDIWISNQILLVVGCVSFFFIKGILEMKTKVEDTPPIRVPSQSDYNFSTLPKYRGRKPGCSKNKCQTSRNCKLWCRYVKKWYTVRTLGLTNIIITYIPEQQRKHHYEGENFIHKLCSVLEIFTNKGSHTKSWFKSGGIGSRTWIFATGLCRWIWVSNRSWNMKRGSNAISGFRENWESRSLPLSELRSAHGIGQVAVFRNFLGKHWTILSPVSCFRTDSTHIIICYCPKQFVARIRDSYS